MYLLPVRDITSQIGTNLWLTFKLKSWVFWRSLAAITELGSPPRTCMSVSGECCVLHKHRPLRRSDPLPRGVLPSVCVYDHVNSRHQQWIRRSSGNKNSCKIMLICHLMPWRETRGNVVTNCPHSSVLLLWCPQSWSGQAVGMGVGRGGCSLSGTSERHWKHDTCSWTTYVRLKPRTFNEKLWSHAWRNCTCLTHARA